MQNYTASFPVFRVVEIQTENFVTLSQHYPFPHAKIHPKWKTQNNARLTMWVARSEIRYARTPNNIQKHDPR